MFVRVRKQNCNFLFVESVRVHHRDCSSLVRGGHGYGSGGGRRDAPRVAHVNHLKHVLVRCDRKLVDLLEDLVPGTILRLIKAGWTQRIQPNEANEKFFWAFHVLKCSNNDSPRSIERDVESQERTHVSLNHPEPSVQIVTVGRKDLDKGLTDDVHLKVCFWLGCQCWLWRNWRNHVMCDTDSVTTFVYSKTTLPSNKTMSEGTVDCKYY